MSASNHREMFEQEQAWAQANAPEPNAADMAVDPRITALAAQLVAGGNSEQDATTYAVLLYKTAPVSKRCRRMSGETQEYLTHKRRTANRR